MRNVKTRHCQLTTVVIVPVDCDGKNVSSHKTNYDKEGLKSNLVALYFVVVFAGLDCMTQSFFRVLKGMNEQQRLFLLFK
jgi:hypothetical protein